MMGRHQRDSKVMCCIVCGRYLCPVGWVTTVERWYVVRRTQVVQVQHIGRTSVCTGYISYLCHISKANHMMGRHQRDSKVMCCLACGRYLKAVELVPTSQ